MSKQQIKSTAKTHGSKFYKDALIEMIIEASKIKAMHEYDYLEEGGYCISAGYYDSAKQKTPNCDDCTGCKMDHAESLYKEFIEEYCEELGVNPEEVDAPALFVR